MADNIDVTPGSGKTVATDERSIGGATVHIHRVGETGAANFIAAQVTVSNSSTTILAARETRKRAIIANYQTVPVYIESGTAATSDFRLNPGDSIVLYTDDEIDGITALAYTASGDQKVHVIEEWD